MRARRRRYVAALAISSIGALLVSDAAPATLDYRAAGGLAHAPAGNRIAAAAYGFITDVQCSEVAAFALDGSDGRHLTDNCAGMFFGSEESEYGPYVGWPSWQPLLD